MNSDHKSAYLTFLNKHFTCKPKARQLSYSDHKSTYLEFLNKHFACKDSYVDVYMKVDVYVQVTLPCLSEEYFNETG